MGDYLLYEVWGGLIFNLPFIAISVLLGYFLAKKYAKGRDLNKKVVYLITAVLSIVFFLVLKLFAM